MALNYIWVGFFLIAFVVAVIKLIFFQDYEIFAKLVQALFDSSETAFRISIGLTGILTLWLGLMRIAEKSGIVKVMAIMIGPFFKHLFPGIPIRHRAMFPIMMNFAANMLGLDNAATPMGLKAMKEMQRLNPSKDTATDAQIMFLVLNTSGLTLIPITVIMFRSQFGATQPTDVFIPILLATLCSTVVGLLVVSVYQRLNLFKPVVMAYLGGIIAFIAGTIYAFQQMEPAQIEIVTKVVSNFILFFIITYFIFMALRKRRNAYELFIEGAKEGFQMAITIIPFLVAILASVAVFRASGGMSFFISGIGSFFEFLGVDTRFVEALPTAFMKPLSGGGARGMMIDLMKEKEALTAGVVGGANYFSSTLACVLQGSTDTTLYVLAVYFGSVSIRKTRHALTCGLLADLAGIIAAIFISYLFFGDVMP